MDDLKEPTQILAERNALAGITRPYLREWLGVCRVEPGGRFPSLVISRSSCNSGKAPATCFSVRDATQTAFPRNIVHVTELIWEGKYDPNGRKVAPPRIALPFRTVETVNERRVLLPTRQ